MVKDFKGAAGKPNQLPRTNASSKLGKGRRKDKDPGSQRSAETIARLKMYNNGKAIRNKAGKIVAGSFMMGDRAGDRKITAETGRIQPDRRWFGNTRTVAATDLDKFRQEMTEAVSDPYSVVLKRKKLPMGLLQDAAEYSAGKAAKSALLDQEPFQHAFGSQSRRKRVKLDQLLVGRSMEAVATKGKKMVSTEGVAEAVARPGGGDDKEGDDAAADDAAGYRALFSTAQISQDTYQTINAQEGIVPWGRDSNLEATEGEGVDWRHEKKDDLFLKGQSKRIWGEFFKVVDCSDVSKWPRVFAKDILL
jgi:nuclear GTP-binding protein